VARAVGIQVPKYRRWERGDATPRWDEVGRLVFALNFPPSFFYGETLPELESVHICGPGGCHHEP
jgi:transcriptional regulator with XRE-family HTH domain